MIPFRRWFAYAISALGLSPADFWALTLAEWRWLMPDAPTAMTRAGLDTLLHLYPDEHHDR
jgi:hypothetical protein